MAAALPLQAGGVPLEVYLQTADYEPDAEYVDGQIEERPMGQDDHSAWQDAIGYWFRMHADEWKVRVRPELRVQTGRTRVRIPDVAILDQALPLSPIAVLPPLAVFEILSPDDRVQRLAAKLGDYAGMGVAEIWVLNPETKLWWRYEDGQLLRRDQFALAGRKIAFSMAEIAKLVL